MKQKITIVSLTFNEKFGGAEVIAYDHAMGLQQRGYEISVFTGTEGPQAVEEDMDGLRVYRTPVEEISWVARSYKCLHNRKIEQSFKNFLSYAKPDIIHFHNVYYKFPYSLFTAAKQYGAKVYWTAHDVGAFSYGKLFHYIDKQNLEIPQSFNYHTSWRDNLRQVGKAYNPWRNTVIKRHIKNVDIIITVSQALKDALSGNKIKVNQVIHNGIDVAPWQQVIDSAGLRQQLDLGNRSVLLYIGRLTGAKGRDVLLKALKSIPDAFLLIIGENINQGLDKALQEYGLASRVKYIPAVKRYELLPYYKLASVVVVPSVCFDSFPTVNLEAMACQRPVVATCFGGSPEIVIDGKTGYIVNPYNTQLFADRINSLLSNQKLAQEFGQAGFDRVQSDFNLENWLEQLEKLYTI